MTAAQWTVIGLSIFLMALDGFDVLSISFASPGIAKEWGLNFAELGWVLSLELFGMAVGAAVGALMGHFARYGIDEDFVNQVRAKVTPGTSALFLLSSGAVVDKVAEAVKGQQFEIIQTNLSKEQEEQLREAFAE